MQVSYLKDKPKMREGAEGDTPEVVARHLSIIRIYLHWVGPTLRSYPRTTFCLLATCEQAHYISPHELVASYMAGKSAQKSQKRRGPSRDINPAQATHL